MKLFVCASFSIFFGLFAGFGTINGFSIDAYFDGLSEFDDYYYDDSAEPTNDEITLHMWNLELSKDVDDSDSERTKVQPLVQRNKCFAEFLKDIFDFSKIIQFIDFLNHDKKEIHPEPNTTLSEHTTAKISPSTVTPAPDEAAKTVSTETPKVVTTTVESVHDVTTAVSVDKNDTSTQANKL